MASALISSVISLSATVASFFGCGSSQEEPNPKPKEIGEELERLNRMLRRIHAVLQDAEERETRDRSVRLWLCELRGIAYAAEDVLDEYHYEAQRALIQQRNLTLAGEISQRGTKRKSEDELPSSSSSVLVGKVSIPDGMAYKIKSITERLEEISKARCDLHLRECDGERRVIGSEKQPPTTSYVDEITFGRKHEKDELIQLLISKTDAQFVVIPIVGMAGVGKTALAQLIYNDQRVKSHFNHRTWISVCSYFDALRITKAIVESITNKPCGFIEFSTIQKHLGQMLKGQSLLVVLDDVWNEKQSLWQLFKSSLGGAKSVKIITTCRSTLVANIMQTMSPYHLSCLSQGHCWMLFKHYAFGNANPYNYRNLMEIAHKLVKKCDCLPLAVKALGALLKHEKDEQRWQAVLESDIWELDEEKTGILPALRLSYHHLPLHLRPCFCYISMHRKGTAFKKGKMVRQWMAQGYIQPHSRKTLEDIGSEFFDELQCRSFIEPAGINIFKVHDLVHDLATSILQGADLVMLYHEQFGITHLPDLVVPTSCCAVRTFLNFWFDRSVHYYSFTASLRVLELSIDMSELPGIVGTLKHLRYLCIAGPNLIGIPESICHLYNLQTLDLKRSYSLLELPREIGNLTELRFFRLHSEKLKYLPESICWLQNLHTLDLNKCWQLRELPGGIKLLRNLRNLRIFHCFIHRIPYIGMLSNLYRIEANLVVEIDDRNKGLEELKKLNNLGGTLCIYGIQNVSNVEELKVADLRCKANLRNLELTWRNVIIRNGEGHLHVNLKSSTLKHSYTDKEIQKAHLESLQPHTNLVKLGIDGYTGISFPSWLSDPLSLPNLTSITLKGCITEGNLLSAFGDLPCLNKIQLISCANLQKIQTVPKNVEHLEISKCDFHVIRILPQSKLQRLHIIYCIELSSIHVADCGHEFLNTIILVGCSKLKFITVPDNLRQLLIYDYGCHEIWINITPKSKLEDLCIMLCKELYFINLMNGELSCLNRLSVMGCHKLQNLPVIPSKLNMLEISSINCQEILIPPQCELQDVRISHCRKLASISGLHELTSIRQLSLVSCPLLQITMDMLGSKPDKFEIYNFPVLDPQLEVTGPNNQGIAASNKLVLSGDCEFYLSDTEIVKLTGRIYGLTFATLDSEGDSIEIPLINSMSCQIVKVNLPWLVSLEICNCNKLVMLSGLSKLTHLKFLLLVECRQLHYWTDRHLPVALVSMVIISCYMLNSIPQLDKHLRYLEELEIWKCSKLKTIQGLHKVTSLKTLKIIDCSEVCISLAERLQARLEFGTVRNCPRMIHWCSLNKVPLLQQNKQEDKMLESIEIRNGDTKLNLKAQGYVFLSF
ncbi:Disease resistance protein RGA2 [Rhynchospora pubera]|uniref:Disease resistance protein RGA2 n=1 Tax=Rhynchospora pubera TaxID=906938 RepID=A0AAV8GNJ9_9POAL|nr:Disease resistance protein RGA2 [Rhynchospora pubera]